MSSEIKLCKDCKHHIEYNEQFVCKLGKKENFQIIILVNL